ncbi:hypothetical protein [Sulfuracidifex metallicus]|uniref:hypothetical protein n=1 Tax=Sulfuracidifex metallicus TaxID=47303 RepID=UPI002273ACFF|nr:hypothetical protein [Sulfuracidifex metallicus]MCY0851073.1 hypothetical protein [Sulfuracidifex metallicus]
MSEMSTCYEILQKAGYDLSKYNENIVANLKTSHGDGTLEVCQLFLLLLELQFGR